MTVYRTDPDPFIEAADILKAISHPQRLCIVKTLCEQEESSVTDMQHCLDEPQAKVSQHLQKLKAARIIVGKRDGTSIFYSISNKELKEKMAKIIAEFF